MVRFGKKQEGWIQGKNLQMEPTKRYTNLIIPFNKLNYNFKIKVCFSVSSNNIQIHTAV